MALRILHNIYIKYYNIYSHKSKNMNTLQYVLIRLAQQKKVCVCVVYLKKCIYVVVEGMVGLSVIVGRTLDTVGELSLVICIQNYIKQSLLVYNRRCQRHSFMSVFIVTMMKFLNYFETQEKKNIFAYYKIQLFL